MYIDFNWRDEAKKDLDKSVSMKYYVVSTKSQDGSDVYAVTQYWSDKFDSWIWDIKRASRWDNEKAAISYIKKRPKTCKDACVYCIEEEFTAKRVSTKIL